MSPFISRKKEKTRRGREERSESAEKVGDEGRGGGRPKGGRVGGGRGGEEGRMETGF